MKHLNVILVITLISSWSFLQAQEPVTTESKFSMIVYGGIGFGKLENDVEPNYNLNSNKGHLLLNYRLSNEFGIATGIGYNQLSGNGFSSIGNFYHERDLLKIPVLLTMEKQVVNNIRLVANLGAYTQTIIKDDYRYLLGTQEDVYEGWNFGFQVGIGFAYQFDELFSLGLNISTESDFTKLKTNDSQIVDDEQKFVSNNTIGLLILIDL